MYLEGIRRERARARAAAAAAEPRRLIRPPPAAPRRRRGFRPIAAVVSAACERWRFEIPPCPPAAMAAPARASWASATRSRRCWCAAGWASRRRRAPSWTPARSTTPSAFAGIGEAVASDRPPRRRGAGGSPCTATTTSTGSARRRCWSRRCGALRADVDWYLPDRAGDGYGLSGDTVRRLAARGTALLVTVDCGDHAPSRRSRPRCALGWRWSITDHHSPRADGRAAASADRAPGRLRLPVPRAVRDGGRLQARPGAVRRPAARRPARARGASSTWWRSRRSPTWSRWWARTARWRVRGLRAPGGHRQARAAGADGGRAGRRRARSDERAVAFALAPRLNAAGRLYRADAALELLLTEDPVRAAQVAQRARLGQPRAPATSSAHPPEAEAQMAELGEREALRARRRRAGTPGVIGIVASRLVERSGRPVVMVALDGEDGRGSGRSIDAFDLLGGLRACSRAPAPLRRAPRGRRDGDRARAAGRASRPRCAAHAARGARARGPAARSSASTRSCGVAQVDMGLAEELERWRPFGRGNPRVSLLVEGASFADTRPMGEGRHVRFTVSSGGASARAVAFGCGGRLPVRGRRARRRPPSRSRSTSGTVSASRVWCCAGRGPREQPAAAARPAPGRAPREGQQELALFAV